MYVGETNYASTETHEYILFPSVRIFLLGESYVTVIKTEASFMRCFRFSENLRSLYENKKKVVHQCWF